MHQARHADGRGAQQQFRTRVGIVGRDDFLLKVQPRQPRQQEAAQRPGRVVLAADQEERRHVAFLYRPAHAALQYCPRIRSHDNRMNAASAG
jgi:hypothetical protein